MKKDWFLHRSWHLLAALVMAALSASPVQAQLFAADEGPISIGHHHLNITDLEAQRSFWTALGGVEKKNGPIVYFEFPNLILAVTERDPSGGSLESSVNHIGLQVPDVAALIERVGESVKVVTRDQIPVAQGDVFEIPDQNTRVAFVEGPDGTRVELFENPDLEHSVANHHVHFYTEDPVATRDWYVKHFGAKPRKRGSFDSADLPGVNLTFSMSEGKTVGTQGRSLDHIGFEVQDLEGLCRILEAEGVVFDQPYRKIEALGLEVAFFTDPWGTYVELTEGLADL